MTTNSLFSSILFCLLCWMPSALWADCDYSGCFSLEGTMGEQQIKFAIHATYWGDNPCLVMGETVYTRQNGKTSSIKLYGELNDNGCLLREFVNGHICGNFYIQMPGPGGLAGSEAPDGDVVQGSWWLNEKSHDFNDVSLRWDGSSTKINYTRFRHFIKEQDRRRISGEYNCSTNATDVKNRLSIEVEEDSIRWHTEAEDEMGGWDCRIATPNVEDWDVAFAPSVDGGKFQLIAMDDVVLMMRTNEIPEETDDFVNPTGTFVKTADHIKICPTRSFDPKNPSCCSYAQLDLRIPRTDSQQLNKAIFVWVGRRLGYDSVPADLDYWKMAEKYASEYLNSLDEPERNAEGEIETYQLQWTMITVNFQETESRKYINLSCFDAENMGGVHPLSSSCCETIRRSDGHVMTWKDWFVNPAQVQPLINEYMHKDNPDVEFDSAVLELPENNPYYDKGKMYFSYGQYEAAPYCYGMPECKIPISKLLPFMTQAAKSLVK